MASETVSGTRKNQLAKVRASCEEVFPNLGKGTKVTKLDLEAMLPLTRPTLDKPEYWAVVSEVANTYGVVLPKKRSKKKPRSAEKKLNDEKIYRDNQCLKEEIMRLRNMLKEAVDLLYGHSIDVSRLILKDN